MIETGTVPLPRRQGQPKRIFAKFSLEKCKSGADGPGCGSGKTPLEDGQIGRTMLCAALKRKISRSGPMAEVRSTTKPCRS